jgi:hypothetical protein
MDHKNHLTSAMYEMLGLLNEYISRFDFLDGTPDPWLERFYPHEKNPANRFA